MIRVTDEEELTEIVGEPSPAVFRKATTSLQELDKAWLRHSPLCFVATSAAGGTCDVSPKGDPPGFALVLDDSTLAIADRPGNRRVDSWRNVLTNPHVGLIFLIPGRGDSLRINGRAQLVREAPFFDRMIVKGHRPRLALVVEIEEVYFHCAKAFLRGRVWEPESWTPDAVPSRALIAKATERQDESLASLEQRYGASYRELLY
ncbi:pyridoxamine 5'-phosphate oxidase family protein [Micromonospora andamanensis]|uniref:pyridoxamine 5'-phosphate oxidase family protein n=1 Tax=Micromonospora andamanensis TaxID=1287068 RepID=UPI001951262A|nr:pyridoxamine 5'-phosphate oxidase family protein [Micromonospora andamanensis]